MNFLIMSIAGIITGAIGAMGLGGGGVFLIYLTVFAQTPQIQAQGMNLIFFIPSAMIAVIVYAKKKMIKTKMIIKFAGIGVLGALTGTWISGYVGNNLLSKLFAIFLVILGIYEMFHKI